MLELADVGFLKVHLPTYLVPSTSTPFLGPRSKIIWSSLELAYINGKPPHNNNRSTTFSLDCQILQVTRLQHIGSSLLRCTQVLWHSFTLSMSFLALVNDFHHWSIIQWFLSMLDFGTFIHMVRIVPWILVLMKTIWFYAINNNLQQYILLVSCSNMFIFFTFNNNMMAPLQLFFIHSFSRKSIKLGLVLGNIHHASWILLQHATHNPN